MPKQTDLYHNYYSNFDEQIQKEIRMETYLHDIGQNSWLMAEEFDRFISWLNVEQGQCILEAASGSGGPSSYMAEKTGCFVTGIDINENGILTAANNASKLDHANLLNFKTVNANEPLPFDDNAFDAVVCMDSMNHFPDRSRVLKEWFRVLRPGKRAVFTDPVVITGPVTNEELAVRSSIGIFLFVPAGVNEHIIKEAGFNLAKTEDVTENEALVSKRWHNARQKHKDALIRIEGEERFESLQQFFLSVHNLTAEKRLSRIAYLAEKPMM
jgi:SAM-dependent methyltransferase